MVVWDRALLFSKKNKLCILSPSCHGQLIVLAALKKDHFHSKKVVVVFVV